ncbi:protein-glutamate O-methyltransferase CheR [Leptospira inadai serovar Lyme str. 10]|uniref:protein-glutamate O-methyltransferase n=2 Tax=Leptospira inadai serovar Lyme TaxID=293084 RepID=V6HWV5_9LEPT|nr:protein-glutamate O-methyltransferase CheR [Leptospira inadai]EQA37459.1 protein-glutamate O-methyltransferase CheR [Leptospira inadai serovar Lyme str. 10]PNV73312.1 protein-glutamate O-methyltransferase CheR [Leptospira inadai serovar Lyme]
MKEEMIQFVSVLQKATGIYLSEEKLYLLESRLSDIMVDHKIGSFLDFSKKFENNQEEDFREQVIERITTHETKFFRDISIFEAITQRILPEIVERLEEGSKDNDLRDQKIRIWCAACSTGQEPYSIAIAIKERLPHLFKNVRILATDIAKETIEKARIGCYSPFEIGRGLEEYHTDRYFDKAEDGNFKIKDEIKSIVEFEQHNLISPNFPSGFDLVLCRNVSYYFDMKERSNLFQKIYKSMNPDSFLILGSAESISGFSNNFIIREFGLCRYYEINSTSVTLF